MKKLSLIVSVLTILSMALIGCSNPAGGDSNSNGTSSGGKPSTGGNTSNNLNTTKEITDLTLIDFSGNYDMEYIKGYNPYQSMDLNIKDHNCNYRKKESTPTQEKPIYVYKIPFEALPETVQQLGDKNIITGYYVINDSELSKFTLKYDPNDDTLSHVTVIGADYFGLRDTKGDYDYILWNSDTQIKFWKKNSGNY